MMSATNPSWQISTVAKLDTGASRTCIDVSLAHTLRLKAVDTVTIKNSHGKQIRQLVEVELYLNDKIYPVRASVTNRAGLSCPVLIGRDILETVEESED